jgi:hypothetical protein
VKLAEWRFHHSAHFEHHSTNIEALPFLRNLFCVHIGQNVGAQVRIILQLQFHALIPHRHESTFTKVRGRWRSILLPACNVKSLGGRRQGKAGRAVAFLSRRWPVMTLGMNVSTTSIQTQWALFIRAQVDPTGPWFSGFRGFCDNFEQKSSKIIK